MALIGQNQQTLLSNPQNGQSPIDADVVRNNDNALRSKINAHDGDATIHVQTGTLAARPAAGTAGAMYMDENGQVYRDTGAAWVEVPYARLSAAGTNAFTNNVTVGGTLGVTGATTLGALDAANVVCDDVDAGAITAASVSANTLTAVGTVTGASFTGAATGLTAIPTGQLTAAALPTGVVNATNIPASRITAGTAQGAITAPGLTSSAGVSMTGGAAAQTPRTATLSAGTHAIDCSTGNWFERVVNGNVTLSFTNFAVGQEIRVLLQQGSGAATATFTGVAWSAATGAPVLTLTISRWDTYLFAKRNDGTVMGYIGEQNHV